MFPDGESRPRTVALFPDDRALEAEAGADIVRVKLTELALRRTRQWGTCWLAYHLYQELGLDKFWAERLLASRKGTRWDLVLQTLVAYRLIDPGSEWRLIREWFERSAMGDLLGADFAPLAEQHKLYACHHLLVAHKAARFDHLTQPWRISLTPSSTCCWLTSRRPILKATRRFPRATNKSSATVATSGAIACRS
ncbi:MAG: hypothetical protein RL077_5097 [Verrucomicrobiota bacterium]